MEGIRNFPSPASKQRNTDPTPMVMYGYASEHLAQLFSSSSTLNCVAIIGLANLEAWLKNNQAVGIAAMSHKDQPGEAGLAIQQFRDHQKHRGLLLYGAWDYHLGRTISRALEYRADGLLMPGIDTNEMFAYLFGVFGEVEDGSPLPTTEEQHIARLRQYAPTSPFWKGQDRVPSPYY